MAPSTGWRTRARLAPGTPDSFGKQRRQEGRACSPDTRRAYTWLQRPGREGSPREQTWAPAVLTDHVRLHAVLGGEAPAAAGDWAAALRGAHALQVFPGVDVEAAAGGEPGTAPWNRTGSAR